MLQENKKKRLDLIKMVPVGQMGAWETEIPRHDLMGYIKIDSILAAAAAIFVSVALK